MIRADLWVEGLAEVATLAGPPGPRRGRALGELGVVADASIAVARGKVVAVGRSRDLRRDVRLRAGGRRVDAGGGVALPGFVDAHTHVLYAGDRHDEVEEKVRGATYLDIARRGGGILSTVRATRAADDRRLTTAAVDRLRRLGRSGVTSAEVKSGYGLSTESELRLLRLIPALERRSGVRVVPTFLGAHAVPPEFDGRPDAYVDDLIARALPVVAAEKLARFADVFVEPGFFSAEQGRRLLVAARARGLSLKIHADEFADTGGARIAVDLGAASADHLLATPKLAYPALAASSTIAVLLPMTPFSSLAGSRSPGREMVDAGVAVALGSDHSPNSPVESFPMVLAHAVYSARLTPAEAIVAATVNSAHAIGLGEVAGTLSVGAPADLSVFPVAHVTEVASRLGVEPTYVFSRGNDRFSR